MSSMRVGRGGAVARSCARMKSGMPSVRELRRLADVAVVEAHDAEAARREHLAEARVPRDQLRARSPSRGRGSARPGRRRRRTRARSRWRPWRAAWRRILRQAVRRARARSASATSVAPATRGTSGCLPAHVPVGVDQRHAHARRARARDVGRVVVAEVQRARGRDAEPLERDVGRCAGRASRRRRRRCRPRGRARRARRAREAAPRGAPRSCSRWPPSRPRRATRPSASTRPAGTSDQRLRATCSAQSASSDRAACARAASPRRRAIVPTVAAQPRAAGTSRLDHAGSSASPRSSASFAAPLGLDRAPRRVVGEARARRRASRGGRDRGRPRCCPRRGKADRRRR